MITTVEITNENTYCEHCGKQFKDGETVSIFQDEQGFDILPGFYCEKCEDFFTEHGDHIITQAIIDAQNECASFGGKGLNELDDPYSVIAGHLPSGIGYSDVFPEEDGETGIEWAERVQEEVNSFWRKLY